MTAVSPNAGQGQSPGPTNSQSLPFFRPTLGSQEVEMVTKTLLSGWLTSGPLVRQFEREFAAFIGADHAVAVNSATAALHLALVALDVGPGDEVIVPTMTFASAGEVVLACGATPIFVDVKEDSLAIDNKRVEQAITERTRVIMPMHYGGLAADLAETVRLAREHGDIAVVDDAAHALPTPGPNGLIGTGTHGTCFSFYANKTITTGEGGMFATSDPQMAERVKKLSLHGLSGNAWSRFETRAAWDYDIVEPGWKYNMTDLAAAIGIPQLARAQAFADQRRAIARLYDYEFAGLPGLTPVSAGSRDESACHLYVLRVDATAARFTRNDVIEHLRAKSIGTSVHYRPLHMHTYYRDQYRYLPSDFPVAATAFDQIVSLPIFPGMTEQEVDLVVRSVVSTGDQ